METIYRIPSKLYFELYQQGGDRLVSVYSILKKSKKNDVKYYAFTSKNGKKVSHYNLIRNYTGLTLHSIKKYTDILIGLGLCSFDDKGNFILAGNQKLKKIYNNKLVPIKIGKNIVETSYNSLTVRLHSNQVKQQRQINKKHNQRVLLSKSEEQLTYSDIKQIKSLKSKETKGFEVDKCVLTIKSYAKLKDGSENNKSKGQYWKQKLIKNKLIDTKRRFQTIRKMSFEDYKIEKAFLPKSLKFYKGYLIKEIESEFNVKTELKNNTY
jgi:hypothetical protein